MNTNKAGLLFALLSAVSASTQAAARPDWEQALALAPAVDGALALPRFELAEPGSAEVHAVPGGWEPVDGGQLEELRGGFTMPSGLVIALGIERLVSINGELVARTSFDLSAVGSIAGEAAEAAREALNSGGLIQNGPGNIAPVLSADALGATVIQNTLNDQTIRSQTIINASVNSATLMQSLNFNDSVGQAIRDAVRLN